MKSPSSRPFTAAIVLAVIVIGGMAIRSYGMTDRSIWFDEAASWWTIQFPWRQMLARIAADNHVPLYYVLLRIWTMAFGDSLAAMRGLSVLLSGVTMAGVYLFASAAFSVAGTAENQEVTVPYFENGRWIGLVAAALVAVSLLQIRAAWEVRMYTLGTALTAISSWTLFRALHAPVPCWRPWAMHAVATLLLAYTHHFAMFSIAGQIAFLLGFFLSGAHWKVALIFKNPAVRPALLCYGFVALGWALWLPVLIRQVRLVQKEWWLGPLRGQQVLQHLQEMIFGSTMGRVTDTSLLLTAAGLAAVVLALAWRAGKVQWYILSLAVLPVICALIVSVIGKNVFLSRYLVFAQMFLLIGIAALLARLRRRWTRHAAATLLVAGSVASCVEYWRSLDLPNHPGMKGVIAAIESQRRPDEHVVLNGSQMYFTAIYHLHDRSHYHIFNNGRPAKHFLGGNLLRGDEGIFASQLVKLGPGRVWVTSQWNIPSIPIPANWHLEDTLIVRDIRHRHDEIKVEKYEIGPSHP